VNSIFLTFKQTIASLQKTGKTNLGFFRQVNDFKWLKAIKSPQKWQIFGQFSICKKSLKIHLHKKNKIAQKGDSLDDFQYYNFGC
jgi:hypothetical protein